MAVLDIATPAPMTSAVGQLMPVACAIPATTATLATT